MEGSGVFFSPQREEFWQVTEEKTMCRKQHEREKKQVNTTRDEDRQHVQEMDKQMDHMCDWQGSRIPQAAMKPVHPPLKQTDTVSEPLSQLAQPAKM